MIAFTCKLCRNPGCLFHSSVQFSSVVSNSLRLHGLQHAGLPCPSPIARVCSNSCPLSQWCHPTISSYVIPFSSCLQSFPASGSFPMSQLFASGGQSTGVSASASVLPMNIQGWFPLARVFSITTVWKNQFFITPTHIHTWLLGKLLLLMLQNLMIHKAQLVQKSNFEKENKKTSSRHIT